MIDKWEAVWSIVIVAIMSLGGGIWAGYSLGFKHGCEHVWELRKKYRYGDKSGED